MAFSGFVVLANGATIVTYNEFARFCFNNKNFSKNEYQFNVRIFMINSRS